MNDDLKQAVQAECAGKLQGAPIGRSINVADEMHKNAQSHYEAADRLNRGAHFLTQHPEFDEFMRLIRSGALQF